MSDMVRLDFLPIPGSDEGCSAAITLTRSEKRNALTRQMIQDLCTAVKKVSEKDDCRVLTLAAEGKVFCAGMDLGEMQERAQSEDKEKQWQIDSEVYCDLLKELFDLPIPTVVKLQGPVLAGGVGMVLACDMIVSADECFLALPEPMRGIVASMVTPLLAHRVGPAVATAWLLSGQRVSAQRAKEVGLIHETCSLEELDGAVDKLMGTILTGSRSALAITKAHLNDCVSGEIHQLLEKSIEISAQARETEDAREGLAAFLEKRQAKWIPKK